jgi:HAD superfamily hydrolase (TIGR01509 family)
MKDGICYIVGAGENYGKAPVPKGGTCLEMNFEAAIFDLDGTLLNSMDVWEKIDIAFLSKRGLPVPINYVTEICARSFEEAAQYTIELFELSEGVESIIKEWNAMAAYEYAHHVRLMPYTLDYMSRLNALRVKLAVATGLPEELYKPCLTNNGVYESFDIICSTDQVERGKEYPDIFLFASGELKIPPQKCIVFEDVLPAVRSAKQAGMITYGVYDKYSAHNESEIKAIADGYLYDFRNAPLPQKEA